MTSMNFSTNKKRILLVLLATSTHNLSHSQTYYCDKFADYDTTQYENDFFDNPTIWNISEDQKVLSLIIDDVKHCFVVAHKTTDQAALIYLCYNSTGELVKIDVTHQWIFFKVITPKSEFGNIAFVCLIDYATYQDD